MEEKMACGVGVCLGCPVKTRSGGYKMICKDGPVFDAKEIAW
jgi:dihydroorotate dehydrogenase electron transfer subunit